MREGTLASTACVHRGRSAIYLGWVTLNYLCRPLIIVQDAFYVQSRATPKITDRASVLSN